MILVWKYGLRRPALGKELVGEQLALAASYRRHLTALERMRREVLADVENEIGGAQLVAARKELAEAHDAVDVVVKLIGNDRSASRSKDISPERSAEFNAAKKRLGEARKNFYGLRRLALRDPGFKRASGELLERCIAQKKYLRATEAPEWGTYQLVELAARAASKTTPFYGRRDQLHWPRFSWHGGQGSIGVQIIKGSTVESIMGGKHRQVQLVDVTRHDHQEGSKRRSEGSKRHRRDRFYVLRLRVGSDARRKPVWAEWPMLMHRPFPEGTIIKRVDVHMRRVAYHEEWSVTFTASIPDTHRSGPCGHGAVAVNFGWRNMADGTRRVATYGPVGEEMKAEHFSLSEHTLRGLDLPDVLHGLRDRTFLPAKEGLRTMLASGVDVPAWVSEKTKTLARWNSPGRLAALVRRWTLELNLEVTRDEYEAWAKPTSPSAWTIHDLAIWCHQDSHLWAWEDHQRKGSLRNRRDQYRVFAQMLAERYHTLVIDEFKITDVATVPEIASAEEAGDNPQARANRHKVAVSELREIMMHAFVMRGGEVVRVPTEKNTIQCWSCGHVDRHWNPAEELEHRCSNCGRVWDQDDNNVANLIRRYVAALAAPPSASAPDVTDKKRVRIAIRRKKVGGAT